MSVRSKGKSRKGKNETGNYNSTTLADLEQDSCYGSLGQKESKGYDTPCHIVIHSVRRRLADADGISGKAAIDGLIHTGILLDDSPKFVESVTFSQEKTSGQEKTIIRIY